MQTGPGFSTVCDHELRRWRSSSFDVLPAELPAAWGWSTVRLPFRWPRHAQHVSITCSCNSDQPREGNCSSVGAFGIGVGVVSRWDGRVRGIIGGLVAV